MALLTTERLVWHCGLHTAQLETRPPERPIPYFTEICFCFFCGTWWKEKGTVHVIRPRDSDVPSKLVQTAGAERIYIHVCTHSHTAAHTAPPWAARVCVCVRVRVRARACVCVFVHMYIYIYVYICGVSVCAYT